MCMWVCLRLGPGLYFFFYVGGPKNPLNCTHKPHPEHHYSIIPSKSAN